MIVVGSHPAHEVNLNGRLSLREYLHNALPDIQGGGSIAACESDRRWSAFAYPRLPNVTAPYGAECVARVRADLRPPIELTPQTDTRSTTGGYIQALAAMPSGKPQYYGAVQEPMRGTWSHRLVAIIV